MLPDEAADEYDSFLPGDEAPELVGDANDLVGESAGEM